MAFSVVPVEWWEDGSTGFPPEAWEEDPSHWDGQTACANCGFLLDIKGVAHYLADPTCVSRPYITPPGVFTEQMGTGTYKLYQGRQN